MRSKQDRRKKEAVALVSYMNMLILNTLIQLLTEKGILTKKEVLGRIEKFRCPPSAQMRLLVEVR